MAATESGLKAQKKYREKRKKLACEVDNKRYNIIIEHMQKKGFTSVNAYLLSLIDEDMQK